MKNITFLVKEIDSEKAQRFLEKNHYLGDTKIPKGSMIFGGLLGEELVGVIVYIPKHPAGHWVLYRLAMTDEMPRNSESKFISMSIKIMKAFNAKVILTYIDTNEGHDGTVYKAANFKEVKQELLTPTKCFYYEVK